MSDYKSPWLNCGLILMASTKRTLKIEVNDPDEAFKKEYYVAIPDVEDVLAGRRQTATIIKPKEKQQQ